MAYDHGINEWFSLGAAFTYQGIKTVTTDRSFFDSNGEEVIETFNGKISRTAISVHPLFHYGNSGKLGMYSGLRLGASIWNSSSDSRDPNYNPSEDGFDVNGVSIHASIVAYGLRYYFTENIGAGFEFHLGTPYLTKIGVTARV